jgi:Histidine kinase-, DNA gyrase B-, and HSP90-like ATPase
LSRAPAVRVDLPTSGSTTIFPDPEGLLEALSRIGYSTPEAIGDIVDNSIDAKASRILIRVLRRESRLTSIAIVDDGAGMTEARMEQAMGFGVRTGKGAKSLGKYGMGLKSASFSQCGSLTVISAKRSSSPVGRQWNTDGVRAGWKCAHLKSDVAAEIVRSDEWFGEELRAGTVVRWDSLDAFRVPAARADATLAQLFDSVSLHLGLVFHRFIQQGLRIDLDTVDVETGATSVPRPVQALDPFAYRQSGSGDYPRTFSINLPEIGKLALEAHIWPRKSRSENYLLGRGQVARRQGFYFYRNDRLIQGGGWNGLRSDGEPHLSLARVRVDLSSAFDTAFSLNIQKSGVHVPEGFEAAVGRSKSAGRSFAQYLATAQTAYREKRTGGSTAAEELVPGAGLPSRLRKQLKGQLDADVSVEEVRLGWSDLPDNVFFKWDRDNLELRLNEKFRRAVLNGGRASAADAPLVKLLLFRSLREDLHRERLSSARQRDLTDLQAALVAAARQQERA